MPRPRLPMPRMTVACSGPTRLGPSRLILGSAAAAMAATTLLSGCGGSAKAAPTAGPTLSPVLPGDPTQVVAGAPRPTLTPRNPRLAPTGPGFPGGKPPHVPGGGTLALS